MPHCVKCVVCLLCPGYGVFCGDCCVILCVFCGVLCFVLLVVFHVCCDFCACELCTVGSLLFVVCECPVRISLWRAG